MSTSKEISDDGIECVKVPSVNIILIYAKSIFAINSGFLFVFIFFFFKKNTRKRIKRKYMRMAFWLFKNVCGINRDKVDALDSLRNSCKSMENK